MNKVTDIKTKKSKSVKGRKNVEKRLIDAAAELVGSIGPNQLTIRDIADHAGVNHAQIHHYFGGKQGLLIATYKQLAFEHVEQLERRNITPVNLGEEPLGEITDNYFKAIIRAVLDGNMDLAMIQADSNLSMSQRTLDRLTKFLDLKKPNSEAKAAIAIIMIVEFGLSSMRPYIEEVLELNDKDNDIFMNLFFEARELGLKKVLKKIK
jgi:AcrR family transcriptional regulator